MEIQTSNVFVTGEALPDPTPEALTPSSNVFVFDNSAENAAIDSCEAIIGWRSVLPVSTVSGDNEKSDFPFSNCLDFRDNTQYSPNLESGTVVIEFNQTTASPIDYLGIGIHNGGAALLTGQLEVEVNGVFQVVSIFTALGDNRTIVEYFEAATSSRQRLTLNFSNPLFIGNIYLGKAWVFDKTPSLGFTPASTNSLDQLEGFVSETNQFVMGRTVERGFGQKGQFNFMAWQGDQYSLNSIYREYMFHVKAGKAVFMKWNKDLNQNFFGRASNPNSLQAPAYDGNNHGTFYFDYRGFD